MQIKQDLRDILRGFATDKDWKETNVTRSLEIKLKIIESQQKNLPLKKWQHRMLINCKALKTNQIS